MYEYMRNRESFVGYDYMDLTVSLRIAQLYIDCYENFGWILDGKETPLSGVPVVMLRFKRDRKILNKVELTRLQRHFDACIKAIDSLEKSKTIKASIAAYSIGVIGCGFLVGSVFAYLAAILPLSIVLAIPGIAGWILPYFCYVRLIRKRTEIVTPFIEEKYEELYDVCEKAHRLLA